MTISIGSDTGKRYTSYALAFGKEVVSAELIKVQEKPNLHGPDYRQPRGKQPECDLACKLAGLFHQSLLRRMTHHAPVEFTVEVPTSADFRAKKIKPADLRFVTLTAGAMSAMVPEMGYGTRTRFIEPSEWKSNASDEATWHRINKELTPTERSRVGIDVLKALYGAEWHHPFESVGILLWSLWRI